MMNKKFAAIVAALLMVVPVFAQEKTQASQYLERYNLLSSKLGATGLGIETLLGKWEKDWPDDVDMLVAKFLFKYSKSRTDEITKLDASKYLGQDPVLALKDSLGNDANYFQTAKFDDELFGDAIKAIDKAIQLAPDRIDLRYDKITALIEYEKESPDMATSEITSLIDYNASQHPKWTYSNDPVDKETFDAAIQEYCYTLFKSATPACYEAFKTISDKMLSYDPKNTLFMDNIGSYYLVAKQDNKAALAAYNKVLKLKKDDITAIQNCILVARHEKNVKLEKKYLPMMAKYGDENQAKSAQVRLEALNGK